MFDISCSESQPFLLTTSILTHCFPFVCIRTCCWNHEPLSYDIHLQKCFCPSVNVSEAARHANKRSNSKCFDTTQMTNHRNVFYFFFACPVLSLLYWFGLWPQCCFGLFVAGVSRTDSLRVSTARRSCRPTHCDQRLTNGCCQKAWP